MRVLVVEDTKVFANMLQRRITAELGCEVLVAESYAAAKALIETPGSDFAAALLDLTLEDSFEGEIVDLVAPRIPAIVLTGNVTDDMRDFIWSKGIVDYVTKDSPESIAYAIKMLDRLRKNRDIRVLVVDDSGTMRKQQQALLETHRFQVLTAKDGYQALERLEQHPDIRLVLTDYNMPGLDGFALVREIRRRYDKNRLAIIGLSAEGNRLMSAKFIKGGANDFLNKPFISEEFYCRVNHTLEMLENIAVIEELSNRDPLTGLSNRRHFFTSAHSLEARARKTGRPLVCAMLDIDHFKHINDTTGHDVGDLVLKELAALLREVFGEHGVVARFGGEEFCVLLGQTPLPLAVQLCEELRQRVQSCCIASASGPVHFTVSVGCSAQPAETLQQRITQADALLYEAKNSGRNRVLFRE